MNPHPHQLIARDRALAAPGRRFVFGDEMGTGKTVQSCLVMQALQAQRSLIVTPALVRGHWLRRLDEWWAEHPPVGIIAAGRDNNSLTKKAQAAREAAHVAPIQVVSWNLLGEIDLDRQLDIIILDESQRIRKRTTQFSRNARELVLRNPQAAVLELTGTLMANRPSDAFNQLDTLCPGRFGSLTAFRKRYQIEEVSEYTTSGFKYHGLNTKNADELRRRIEAISTRVTRAEIAHLLPAFDVRPIYVTLPNSAPPVLSSSIDIAECLYGYGINKIPIVLDWYEGAAEVATHVAILTHHRELARKVAAALENRGLDRPVVLLDGYDAEKRGAMIQEVASMPGAVIVATMHSIGIGIDMTFATRALCVELVDDLEVVLQAMGRFSRLSGTVPSSVEFLIAKGTIDEVIADHTLTKLRDINGAMKAGQTDSILSASLSGDNARDWREELREAIVKSVELKSDYLEDDDE